MTKILYNFDSIDASLENMTKILNSINDLETSIGSLKVDVSELTSSLNSAKKTTKDNINSVFDTLEYNIKKTKKICEDYQEYENNKVSTDEFLNKKFVVEEVVNTYTVVYGDTLSSIAKRENVTVDQLYEANKDKIKDKNLIIVGDVLIIPKSTDTNGTSKVENNNNSAQNSPSTSVSKGRENDSTQNSPGTSVPKEEDNNFVQGDIAINYHTSTIDGNRKVAGDSGYTMNEVLTKIKQECESQGIGKYWIDICAISLWETGNYTSTAFKNNNPGGLSYSDGSTRYSFSTLDEGIKAFVSNLNKNYISEGRTTLEQISTKYCPSTAANWTKNVKIMKSQLERCIS